MRFIAQIARFGFLIIILAYQLDNARAQTVGVPDRNITTIMALVWDVMSDSVNSREIWRWRISIATGRIRCSF